MKLIMFSLSIYLFIFIFFFRKPVMWFYPRRHSPAFPYTVTERINVLHNINLIFLPSCFDKQSFECGIASVRYLYCILSFIFLLTLVFIYLFIYLWMFKDIWRYWPFQIDIFPVSHWYPPQSKSVRTDFTKFLSAERLQIVYKVCYIK